jgi:kumamolisin
MAMTMMVEVMLYSYHRAIGKTTKTPDNNIKLAIKYPIWIEKASFVTTVEFAIHGRSDGFEIYKEMRVLGSTKTNCAMACKIKNTHETTLKIQTHPPQFLHPAMILFFWIIVAVTLLCPKSCSSSMSFIADPSLHVNIHIQIPHEDPEQISELAKNITDPHSKQFRKFLSSEEFCERFCPKPENVQAMVGYLQRKGVDEVEVVANGVFISVRAKVSVVNSIFHTTLVVSNDTDTGDEFIRPLHEDDVRIPRGAIQVSGLDTSHRARRRSPLFEAPFVLKEPRSFGFNGGKGMFPQDMRKAYSIPDTMTGDGEIGAVVEFDTYNPASPLTYMNRFGIDVPLENVMVAGGLSVPGAAEDEVNLDIEIMVAMAPRAQKVLVYISPNGIGLGPIMASIASQNRAKVISCSWGIDELSVSQSILNADLVHYQQMAIQGQTLLAASGDHGAFDDPDRPFELIVDQPCSQAYVTCVGGTRLSLHNDGSYLSETTWHTHLTFPYMLGSGGGFSAYILKPSYQIGVINSTSPFRHVPDVSAAADPDTGYFVISRGLELTYGGTSCSAPLWAGFMLGVNQARTVLRHSSVGFANPVLYSIGLTDPQAFHDISDHSHNGFYVAVAGYDLATGWGSMNTPMLLPLIVSFGSSEGNTSPPTSGSTCLLMESIHMTFLSVCMCLLFQLFT